MSMFANNVLLGRVGLGLWFGLENKDTAIQWRQLSKLSSYSG